MQVSVGLPPGNDAAPSYWVLLLYKPDKINFRALGVLAPETGLVFQLVPKQIHTDPGVLRPGHSSSCFKQTRVKFFCFIYKTSRYRPLPLVIWVIKWHE